MGDANEPGSADLTTADGVALAAELFVPPEPWVALVVAHPHPQYGGDMHAPVNAAMFDWARRSGAAAIRFDFRGAGGSGGTHGGGRPERLDVQAAADALAASAPGVPLVLSGWSFGADVSLGVDLDAVAGWCCVAAPLQFTEPAEARSVTGGRPVLFCVPEHDQIRSPSQLEPELDGWAGARSVTIGQADHFLAGRVAEVVECLDGFCRQVAAAT